MAHLVLSAFYLLNLEACSKKVDILPAWVLASTNWTNAMTVQLQLSLVLTTIRAIAVNRLHP